jgi:very-short-patch-repair endonuclease
VHGSPPKRIAWDHHAKFSRAAIGPAVAAAPLDRARRLRRVAGDAARKFWGRVRNRRFGGFKFRREVPLGPYIADFVCSEAQLVVEIDGDQHAEAQAYDAARTRCLERLGYAVIRIPTHEVLHDIAQVLDRLHLAIGERMLDPRRR